MKVYSMDIYKIFSAKTGRAKHMEKKKKKRESHNISNELSQANREHI